MDRRTLWLPALALLAAAHHPTPTVVLAKQADVIKATLEGATKFFVRKVTLGKDDLARIQKEVDYSPQDPDVTFYLGTTENGKLAGVVLFPQVNTSHGPIEVGLAINPDGTVVRAVVTKATVETKPWVEQAVAAGLTRRFQGLRHGDDVSGAFKEISAGQIGQMPYWEATVIASAVKQGLVLHHLLFHEGAE